MPNQWLFRFNDSGARKSGYEEDAPGRLEGDKRIIKNSNKLINIH
jgi:hypothetical protein